MLRSIGKQSGESVDFNKLMAVVMLIFEVL